MSIKIDRKNINVPLSEAQTMFINLNLEILIGCKWKCKGCYVDLESLDNDRSLTKDLSNIDSLTDDIIKQSMTPATLFIGPTDLFVASNAVEILNNKYIQALAHKFLRISFLTTFLSKDEEHINKIINILNDKYEGVDLEINMVVDAGQIKNDQYLHLLKNNRDHIFNKLTSFNDIGTHVQFNVFDYSSGKIKQTMSDYASVRNKIMDIFNTDIDFNFSVGRKDNLSNDEFVESIRTVTDVFSGSLDNESIKYAEFSMGNPLDSNVERQYNFKNGQLYLSPYIYEQYVSFDDAFRIPMKNWKFEEIDSFMASVLSNSYIKAMNMECGTCPYLSMCAERNVIHSMIRYGEKSCILAKDSFDLINGDKIGE